MFKHAQQSLSYFFHARKGHDKIITGVPRSGTTMLCSVLCDIAGTIALNEPVDGHFFPNPQAAKSAIRNHFQKFRRSLYFEGKAVARTKSGQIVDNAYSRRGEGDRQLVIKRTSVQFQKTLQPDFTLLMKHCAEFTLLLPGLTQDFEVYALVRNPLALLSSWRSVQVPVSKGKVAKADRLAPDFQAALQKLENQDLLSRQLYILSWYFEQYSQLPSSHIIFYEELVLNPEKTIRQILGGKTPGKLEVGSLQNRNASYYDPQVKELSSRLLASEGAYWNFYTREQVELLTKQIIATNEQ